MSHKPFKTLNSSSDSGAPVIIESHPDSKDNRAEDTHRMVRIGQKDESAFSELQRQFNGTVSSVSRRIVQNDTDADEVVAETFWIAWNRAADFNSELGSVAAWLVTIARSRAIDRVRQLSRRRNDMSMDEFFDIASTYMGPEEVSIQRERARLLRKAMKQLPEKQQQALELAYFQGMTQCEIAEYCGIPLGTVKTQVRQALSSLRHLFRL